VLRADLHWILRDERRVSVLRRIFGPKRDEVTGGGESCSFIAVLFAK
jgi:hypothetical protein